MFIDRLDHLVLTVSDIEKTCSFYENILGMKVITFGKDNDRKALTFGNQKINLHKKGAEFEPKALFPTAGSADLCFITTTPLHEVITELFQKNIIIEEGPCERNGALSKPILSVYIRDPDYNLIEISNYK
ncbi:hypothetical protein ACTFIZ_011316 [Dictyostelium cf. discoideum]